MRISDWSSDVCSSDLKFGVKYTDHDRVAERFATNGGVFTPGLTCDGAPCTSADFATGGGMPGDFLDNIASPGTLQSVSPCLRRSEEHTSELQSLMRISYAVFCLKKKKKVNMTNNTAIEMSDNP